MWRINHYYPTWNCIFFLIRSFETTAYFVSFIGQPHSLEKLIDSYTLLIMSSFNTLTIASLAFPFFPFCFQRFFPRSEHSFITVSRCALWIFSRGQTVFHILIFILNCIFLLTSLNILALSHIICLWIFLVACIFFFFALPYSRFLPFSRFLPHRRFFDIYFVYKDFHQPLLLLLLQLLPLFILLFL